MTAAVASLSGISKSYDGRPALHELELELRPREVVGLLGPNGAGKTTAVRILCGLLAPDSGSARIDGREIAQDPLHARRALGYVPDGAPLYANLTGAEHLALVRALHELEAERSQAFARRLLEAFDLVEAAQRPVGGYSRGMRQKLAICCALLPEPKLLVLDEPLTGLDAPSALLVKELLRTFADQGGAVLYTSHLLDIVERVCDRMVVLDRGRVIAAGTLDELRAQSGRAGALDEVFRALTQAEDPLRLARRALGLAEPG